MSDPGPRGWKRGYEAMAVGSSPVIFWHLIVDKISQ